MTNPAKTLCPYCGVGCGLEVLPPAQPNKPTHRDAQGNPMWQTRGDRAHPSSQGMVCVKGATVAESLDRDRLRYPMLRASLDAPFERVSWEVALDAIVRRIQTVRDTMGPDGLCVYGSGQFQTEDYYVAQKLVKGCLGTNNFDANSRLCMSSAVAGYIQSFGSDGPPCCYADLEATDCAFLIGTNTAECHPIVFNRLRKHHKRNGHVKLIVVDPRRTDTAKAADLHLAIRPGTDITLLNGIGHLLLRWGAIDPEFIDGCTQGFAGYTEVLRHYAPEIVADRCGITVADLETAARTWSKAKAVLSLWSMGLNQSSEGTAKVRSLINLHLMTGNIGRQGAGPFSLTGQPNAMGGREAGGLSHILPGYRLVKNPDHRRQVEAFWGLPAGQISATPGLAVGEMMLALEQRQVGLLWIAATNPAVSLPDLNRTKAALRQSPFTVYQDAYYPTETAEFAHLLLPAAQWGEKTGTMTNSERVVTLCPAFRPPPGEARPDWEIFAEVGRRLGFADEFAFANSAEVYREFAAITRGQPCDITGLSHDRLAAHGPIQWPCPDRETPETAATRYDKRLYSKGIFATPDRRARFAPLHSNGLAEPPDDQYPFVLTTGRLYGHWHTQTRTGRIEKIQKMHPAPFLEMNPRDAQQLEVQGGEWVEVRSPRGTARLPVLVTQNIRRGSLFVPMHWGSLWADDAECNALTHPTACPISGQPELKACAVQVVPLSRLTPDQSARPEALPQALESSILSAAPTP
ncbi:nitrate reductase [Nodosilinea sp. LEGE 06152]|uniref:molybdopterin oxidoreductase family protein n=1 Tax=Nodosilinea sp. LEGE 06152 TaxID=2777966 RepID=UPI0018801E92|nr:nitrate reductase [Nodosilinea sp. LEGE 06152]MBE9157629.1 nitrate reductase [Nodosilinea sp. LEGE 06152]